MIPAPVHLRYSLSRWQRLVGLYSVWGWFAPLVAIPLWMFFLVQTARAIWTWEPAGVAVFGGLALGVSLLYAGLLRGLVDVVLVSTRPMDVLFEGNASGEAAGVLIGGERWHLFLDGIIDIRQCRGVWIIYHHNGFVLLIPAAAISDEQIEHLRDCMRRGHTPEGMRAVVERGKRIAEIMASEQRR